MGAAGMALFSVLAALSIDLAFLEMEGRRLQSAADLAAMAAARDLDRAAAAAEATARDNLSGSMRAAYAIETRTGAYDADPKTAPRDRFRAKAEGPNAARVRVSGPASLHFGRVILGRDSVLLTREATAARPHQAAATFSIGSRLARLDGGVANQLLKALTGSELSLSALDYRALAEARVSLLDTIDALALEADLKAGDYDGLADAEIDVGGPAADRGAGAAGRGLGVEQDGRRRRSQPAKGRRTDRFRGGRAARAEGGA